MAKLCYTYNGKTYTKSQFEKLIEDKSFEQYNDKTWKMEIPDGELMIQDSSFYEGKTRNIDGGVLTTLSEVFDSKELFEAYPNIRDIQIVFDKNTMINDGALDGNIIYLPYNQIFVSKDTLKSTIIHEIQHIIQQTEGFSRGGNVYSIYDYIVKELGLPENSLKEQTYESIRELAEKNYDPSNYNEVIESVLEGNYLTFLKKGREVYERLAGEVEARNVERRIDMSIEEKAKSLLSETERVSEEDKIYLQNEVSSGIQASSNSLPKSAQNLETTKLVSEYLKDKGFPINILSEQDMIEEVRKRGYESFEAMVTAYHGSPYSFDRFTTDKMGTGEGAQAFGWGLYFTDLESIGRMYAKKLSGDIYSYDGITISGDAHEYLDVVDESLGEDFNEKTIKSLSEKAIDRINKEYIPDLKDIQETSRSQKQREEMPSAIKRLEDVVIELKAIIESKVITKNKNKNLYKVSLHKGKTPSEYTWLEWDKKPNKEQVKELLSRLNQQQLDKGFYYGLSPDATNGLFYKALSNALGGDKQASLFLLENGIDGIKYPAESIARGATSDSARGFNYVVFDENAITIDEQVQFLKAGERIHGFYDVNTNEIYLTEELLNSDTLVHETTHFYYRVLEKQAKSGDLVAKSLLNRFNEIGLEVLGGETKLKSYYDNGKIEGVLRNETEDGNTTTDERGYRAFAKAFVSRYGEQLSGESGSSNNYSVSSIERLLYAKRRGSEIGGSDAGILQTLGFLSEDGELLSLTELGNKFDIDIATETSPFNSEVYSPRQDESYDSYKDRMINEAIARLMGENSVEYFETIAKEAGLNKAETKSFIDRVKQFLNDFAEWLKTRLGLTGITPEQLARMTNKELFDTVTNSMMRGDYINVQPQKVVDNQADLINKKVKEIFTNLNNPINVVTLYTEQDLKDIDACR